MSDLTSDIIVEESAPRRKKAVKTEFMVYFAIIFMATLPLATLTWALAAIKSRSLTDKGPSGPGLEPGTDHHTNDFLGVTHAARHIEFPKADVRLLWDQELDVWKQADRARRRDEPSQGPGRGVRGVSITFRRNIYG